MNFGRTVSFVCVYLFSMPLYLGSARVTKVNLDNYFTDSNYNCYTQSSDLYKKPKNHIRRCKNAYTSETYSTRCIFCPIPCSFCGTPLKDYSFDKIVDESRPKRNCIFHSIHTIHPIKIRSRKGVTDERTVKCTVKDFCKENPCLNEGTCFNEFYSYSCICQEGFNGKNCARKTESSLKGQLTNGLSVWFPLEVVAGRLFPFFVSLYHADKDQVIEISTAQGYTTVIKKENEIKNFEERCKQLKSGDCRCKSCRFGYSGTLLADNYYLKANFDRLPMFTDDLNILGFVSNITVRMYNQVLRTSDGKPYYMDTISSFKTLRIQQVYRSGLFPNCDCSVFAVNEQIRSGYCSAEYLKSPLINSNVQSEFYFQPYFVEFGWQLKKNPGDSRSMLEVGGRFYKKSQASSCFKYEIEYRWRVYKVSTLYRMSDANEDRLAVADFCEFPNQNRKLSEKCTANKRVLQNLPEGHYMVRLTLLTTSFSNTRSIVDNCQSNYVCYFNLKAPKKQFHIDNPSMKDCKASIDTKGFVKNDGYLMWKCTAKTGGPCPPKLASTTRPYLDNVQFYEGEYEICVQYNNNEGVTVGDDCTTLKAENCDEDNDKPDYVIICKDNCLTNPDPTIPFRGGVIDRRHGGNAPKEVTYKVIDSNGKDVPLETIRIHKGVRKNELKIDLSKLNPKERYQIIGTVPNPDGGEPYETPPYDLIYTVADIPKDGNCTISPKEGIKGVSLFDIECFGWQSEGTILYEFFDKSPEDTAHYAGRMIGFSYSGILSKFRLTRGRVVIYLVNEDGEGPMVQFNVTLSDFNSNMTHIEYLMNESDGYVAYNNFHATMDVMSTTSEILYHGLNNDFYLRKILTTMNKVTYDSAESVKLGISTLLSILVNATSNGTYKLNDGLEVAVGEILLKLAQRYLYFATKPDLTPRLRAKFINELTRNMMGCVDMTMIAQDKNVSKLDPEQEVDYDVIDNWNTASNNIAEALMIAMYLVGRAHVYADPGVHLPSSANVTDMYAYVYDAEGLVDIAGNNISSYVRISPELASTFDPNHDIMLQFALMNKNLFWWQKGNINSELIMVGLAEKLYRPGYYYVPRVEAPLQILLKVKNQENTTVSGVTTQLDKELDEDTLDRILLVHRFILPPLSKLFIKFSFNDSSAPSLRVQVLFDERPTWESISSGAVIVNASNSTVELPYEDVEREHFYYMAILPDSNVTVNESVEYSFNLNYINCHIWENQWTNHYCLIGPNTTEETVECLCTHLSIFSSTIFIPPNDINPILDAPLFLSVYTNPWVALFVLLILILFLLLIIWAFKKDRQDALRSEVIVLHDNFPGERCAYLIAIFTGSRLTSSTSAAVGLRLYGELYASRATVLMSDKRKVLQRDSDDWFLLCYPVPLGTLNAVQLWHDNSGKSPDWFCSKIIVYDIDAKTQYLFIVDQWVAMEVNEFPEAMVRPATSDEILGVKRIFVDNSVSGLRENHLFLGVLARHPRSPVARKERLVVLMVLLMTAMLASIMFFEMSDEFDYTVDDYTYNVGEREIIIAIQSCIISALFAFIAMILFRKSYTCTEEEKPKNIDSTLYMPTKRSVDSDIYWRSKKPAFVDLSTFVAYHEAPEKPRRGDTVFLCRYYNSCRGKRRKQSCSSR